MAFKCSDLIIDVLPNCPDPSKVCHPHSNPCRHSNCPEPSKGCPEPSVGCTEPSCQANTKPPAGRREARRADALACLRQDLRSTLRAEA
jgi:hypothetical protein